MSNLSREKLGAKFSKQNFRALAETFCSILALHWPSLFAGQQIADYK